MIPQHFIDDLNRDADLAEVIGRHVKLERKGNSLVGLCPFHQEKTPSFNVVPSKGFYHCFGCGASGNALSFLMKQVHGNDFIAAVRDLAAQLHREIPSDGKGSAAGGTERKVLAAAAAAYVAHLNKNAAARNYLKKRGLQRAVAELYGLGYAPADGGLHGVAEQRLLEKAGLLRSEEGRSSWAYFRDRIMFPISNPSGRVLGFGGRSMDGREPKYLNSAESPWFDKGNIVYGLAQAAQAAPKSGLIIAVEGYMDVLMLAQHQLGCAVATMGTAATERQIRQILARTDRLVFCFDGDDAGRRAAGKALVNAMPALADDKKVEFAFLPQGEDPDSFVRSKGRDQFLELLSANRSKDIVRMLWHPHPDPKRAAAAEGKAAALQRASALIERIDRQRASFLYEDLYRHLSQCSKIDVAQLKEAARLHAKSAITPRPAAAPAAVRQMRPHAVFHLLACLYAEPKLAARLEVIPHIERSKSDSELLLKIREYLLEAEHTDADASVGSYLHQHGFAALRKQLDQQVATWLAAGERLEDLFVLMIEKVHTDLERLRRNRAKRAEIEKG